MSILTDTLPKSLTICGKDCPIRYDFKTWLKFSALIGAKELDARTTAAILDLVFGYLPPNLNEAFYEILKFYSPKKNRAAEKTNERAKRIFDYEYDAELIYAAFLQQYGTDLAESDMHWHKFLALFDNLSEDTQFMKVVGYRSVNLAKIKDNDRRRFYRKMKRLYRLPDNRTEEEKEADFNNSFAGLFV